MLNNTNLNVAKNAKKDEFYTRFIDIESEIGYYSTQFHGKTVLCNCDNPFESNFFKYFVLNFEQLGLKKLISTCYSSPLNNNKPYKAVVTHVCDNIKKCTLNIAELFQSNVNELVELDSDGDFRAPECLKLLDEADIVVTNPPFSLFIDFINILSERNKKFLVIGNQNATTYKDIFRSIMTDQLWLGVTKPKEFIVPSYSADRQNTYIQEDGSTIAKFGNICWFTNLNVEKRFTMLELVKCYTPENYLHYDTYDAINVDKVSDIPCDYSGIMGVPITFLDKYNPKQFEIVGELKHGRDSEFDFGKPIVNGNERYTRILIRNKHPDAPKF